MKIITLILVALCSACTSAVDDNETCSSVEHDIKRQIGWYDVKEIHKRDDGTEHWHWYWYDELGIVVISKHPVTTLRDKRALLASDNPVAQYRCITTTLKM